jgi:hypothetical protein
MHALSFGPTRWRTIRAFGKNPLVRTSDRVEAIVVVSAIVLSLFAASIAGAIGTAVYDSRSRIYAEEAQRLRPVNAIVTTTRSGVPVARLSLNTNIVEARWRSEGIGHTEWFSPKATVAVGDRIDIWVNDKGQRVERPAGFQAAVAAVCVAVPFWAAVIAVSAALVTLVRRLLDRHHDIDWEREIGVLVSSRWAD